MRVCTVALTRATRQQRKVQGATVATRCRLKARLRAPTPAKEHQPNRLARPHMRVIRCQLKLSLQRPRLANVRRQRIQAIKWHRR
ncbi:hypothetical protein ASF77_18520 [Massilia sp. Leaf139]|nr:hypothetical protein ASF77_18520 [Massilia sp. Leaf139]